MRSFGVLVTGILLGPQLLAQSLSSVVAPLRIPEPNPPALTRPEPAEEDHRHAQLAADPTQWFIADLSDEEQKIVELINRARANPTAELTRLQTLADIDVQQAYNLFKVDFGIFAADMAARPVAQPLTPQAQLTTAARKHSQYQLDNAVQSHSEINFTTGAVLNGLAERIGAVGYPWASLRESVYAYAANMEYAHAGFEVDWGFGPGGQQFPPGHRENNHDPGISEIGPGVVVGSKTVVRGGETNSVGPRVVTLDFGTPNPGRTYVTGVAYYDLNNNGAYDEGEGLPGVRVDVSGSANFARTTFAGGYGVPTASGTRTVTFSGTNLPPVTRSVTLAGVSVKADLALPYSAPLLTGSTTPSVGTVNLYQPTPFPNATAYEWRAVQRLPFTNVQGAENGLESFVATTTGTYAPRTTTTHAAGAASYRLIHATTAPQILTQSQELAALAGATLKFSQRFGFSTSGSIAVAEISTNGGGGWTEIWSHPGLGATVIPVANFKVETVPLNLPVGTGFRLRFRYYVTPGSSAFNQQTDERVGFFFDEVSYTNVDQSVPSGSGEVAPGVPVSFTPAVAGAYVLQARPKVGTRTFPFQEGVTVSAQVGPPPVNAVTRITGTLIGPNGKLKVDFSVLPGAATGFDLERTPVLGGVWTRDAAALLATNAPGQLTFRTDPTANPGFFRIRSK